eukprot:g30245.t1
MLRAFVERHNYLWNRWNQIDLLTVVLGWAGVVLAAAASFSGFQFNVLRITRVIRLLRAARVVISIPEFYILVSGLTSSFKAIIFGSVMLVSVIIVWAIIGVELLHPLNAGKIYPDTCWHCKDAFGSVQEAAVTIFKQIVAGDSWGEINEPLALEHPALIPLFFFMFMMISLGCMNLILADCSGEVSYVEFCQQLGTCRLRDPVMMHSLIKYSVMEVQKILNHEIMDTLNEHTEALIEQREMLMEQLQLLHALPVAQKRRAARVLRRQGKKQGKPQYFDENGTAATAYSSHGSDVQEEGSGMVAHQVVNSMESTCQSFEDGELQSQMQSLIRSTEELSSKATNSKQDLLEPGTGTLLAVQTEDAQALSADRNERTTSLNEELERKFSLLLAKLRQRMDDEEVLQRRCTPYPPGGEGNLTKESMAQYTTKSFPPCWPPGPESSGVWGSSITAGLTPHGGEQIRLMGRWMGTSNFSGVSCDDVAETATNWTLGAFPTCKALHQEEVIKGDAKQLCGFQSSKVIQSFLGGGKYEALLNAWKSQIQLVDSVVHCCSSELCPGHLPCNLSSLPIKYTGKFWAEPRRNFDCDRLEYTHIATEGAFDIAVFWAEFFLLEYLNGNPQYAQGQLGVSDLVDLYRMAVENIEIMDDHFASRSFESTMASHILGTLLQAAERKPIPGLSHSQNTKVVYMAGHATWMNMRTCLIHAPEILGQGVLRHNVL